MNSETRYRRVVTGKRVRYEPVAEYCDLDQFPKGYHLLYITPGCRSYRYDIAPDYHAVIAAVHSMRDTMIATMNEANRFNLDKPVTPLTKKQRAVLDEYQRLRGETLTVFKGVSMHDIVEAGLKVLEKGATNGMSEVS